VCLFVLALSALPALGVTAFDYSGYLAVSRASFDRHLESPVAVERQLVTESPRISPPLFVASMLEAVVR
jgi:hypothetical protein